MHRFVDYYQKIQHMPTHQEDVDLELFINRRAGLYRDLGIPLNLLNGKSVIEFGPGGAYNARAILKFAPKKYHFVDAVDSHLAVLDRNITEGKSLGVEIKIAKELFESYANKEKYDLVIAEACIPGQNKPCDALTKIANCVEKNGFLVITNTSKASMLAEILRSVMAKLIGKKAENEKQLFDICVYVFGSHLRNLNAQTRSAEDWVLDNIFHEWHLGKSDFSLPEAHSLLLELGFSYNGGSPAFYRDFVWYKDSQKREGRKSEEVINQYKEVELLLLDYRTSPIEYFRDKRYRNYEFLIAHIENTFDISKKYLIYGEDEILAELLKATRYLSEILAEDFILTSQALNSFSNFAENFEKIESLESIGIFGKWWGRGQQYNSFQLL